MRRSLSPSPYEAAVSMNVMGLLNAARIVSNARSSLTPYANVSGMSPSGAPPTASGATRRPVLPNCLGARSIVIVGAAKESLYPPSPGQRGVLALVVLLVLARLDRAPPILVLHVPL